MASLLAVFLHLSAAVPKKGKKPDRSLGFIYMRGAAWSSFLSAGPCPAVPLMCGPRKMSALRAESALKRIHWQQLFPLFRVKRRGDGGSAAGFQRIEMLLLDNKDFSKFLQKDTPNWQPKVAGALSRPKGTTVSWHTPYCA